MENNQEKIDFVMIWVDGGDPKWQEEKAKYSNNPNVAKNNVNRYRDWENLRYWFRGVEKFAPWVNNVYFITCGHYPEWLNLNAPKLKFVRHEDYIPKEYLPTFNANPIELNFHRIEGLTEKFVYFNDDVFLINDVKKEDFFEGDKPRYIAGCDTLHPRIYGDQFQHILLNDLSIINANFDKRQVIKNNFWKWFNIKYGLAMCMRTLFLLPFKYFPNFAELHIASPMLKTTMKEMWDREFEILDKTSRNKFRGYEDVNQYIFKWFDIVRDNFEPGDCKLGKYYQSKIDGIEAVAQAIKNKKHKIICFSDDMEIDFEKAKQEIINAFEEILPEKSSFEI